MALPSDQQTSPDANEVERTNTLAVTSLPKQFFQPPILHVLRDHFATYGPLNRWVPLPGFSRIIVVYMREDDAETAKIHSDPIVLDQTDDRPQITLRVYRADPNPLLPMEPGGDLVPEANYLRPPEIEKNFLISPPGSPPVGWEPIKEDPPNAAPLADDLMVALRKLQMQEKSSSGSPGVEVLIEPDDGGSGVGVYVQDCVDEEEEEAEENWVYGESAPGRAKWRPVTPMPPPAMMA
ncbi:Calcipressin-domain-containing protein [Favolaschia claudopus]|uniref:Calcipressin-domain-containing protein n=1 Tax=Favolaschia claudopus TaxID=2862362 RepID=A0AAW0DQS4_9AGAR